MARTVLDVALNLKPRASSSVSKILTLAAGPKTGVQAAEEEKKFNDYSGAMVAINEVTVLSNLQQNVIFTDALMSLQRGSDPPHSQPSEGLPMLQQHNY